MVWGCHIYGSPILFVLMLHQIPAVPSDVEEIEEQVERHQCGVEDVQPDDDVVAVQCLVDDAEDIAQNNQGHEHRAFAHHHFGSQ